MFSKLWGWTGWEDNGNGTESTSKMSTDGDLNTLTRASGQETDYPHLNVTTNIEGEVTNAHYSDEHGQRIGTESGEWTTDGQQSDNTLA